MTEVERQILMNQSAIMAALMNAPFVAPFVRSELSKTLLEQYETTGRLLRAKP